MNDHNVINAMLQCGGSFIQQLAKAWCVADVHNQQRIQAAFDREWRHYAELAERLEAKGEI